MPEGYERDWKSLQECRTRRKVSRKDFTEAHRYHKIPFWRSNTKDKKCPLKQLDREKEHRKLKEKRRHFEKDVEDNHILVRANYKHSSGSWCIMKFMIPKNSDYNGTAMLHTVTDFIKLLPLIETSIHTPKKSLL
ncbi:hypothetical protein ACJIZ3_008119 [Penstemon smallii]|uniref:Uncharacterized protein n=1 Tax=Penstemon smallii TaxID=265156 RepID=A0ABD3TAD3_9LAMI